MMASMSSALGDLDSLSSSMSSGRLYVHIRSSSWATSCDFRPDSTPTGRNSSPPIDNLSSSVLGRKQKRWEDSGKTSDDLASDLCKCGNAVEFGQEVGMSDPSQRAIFRKDVADGVYHGIMKAVLVLTVIVIMFSLVGAGIALFVALTR